MQTSNEYSLSFFVSVSTLSDIIPTFDMLINLLWCVHGDNFELYLIVSNQVFSVKIMFKFIFYFVLSEDRIRSGIKKLAKARKGSTQGRLDSFFKVLPSPSPSSKRKVSKTK